MNSQNSLQPINLARWLANKAFLSFSLTLATVSEARFNHLDANQIDPEPLAKEMLIDAKSYEFFESSKKRWDASQNGYRISSGSLSADRFYLVENIKLHSGTEENLSLSYKSRRLESLSESISDEILRVDWSFMDQAYLAFMADGNTFKKHGDLGIAFGAGKNPGDFLELFYYQVDMYYNSKEPVAGNTYSKKPWSAGLNFKHQFASKVEIEGAAEFDAPITWNKVSQNEIYNYSRRSSQLKLKKTSSDEIMFVAESLYEDKNESTQKQTGSRVESMNRRFSQFDLYAVRPANFESQYQKSGIQITRNSTKQKGVFFEEELLPGVIERTEVIGYYLKYRPFLDFDATYFQWGLYISEVLLETYESSQTKDIESTEIKLQTAWESLLNMNSSIVLNLNWNIDRLISHYPYTEKDFLPWNGGNVQLQLQF